MPARDDTNGDAARARREANMKQMSNSTGNAGTNDQAFEEFIGKAEVARRLGVRMRTVDDWMRRGVLPYYKPGHSVRFLWSEVQAHFGETCRVCRKSS